MNAISTQLRDPINSGLAQWRSTVLTGPLFPVGIENLIYMYVYIYIYIFTVRQMGIKGIYISAAPPLIGQERSRNMPTPLQH